MKCLLVRAHPVSQSLCRHLSKHVQKQLLLTGYQIEIEDLYDQEFDPALSANERKSYYKQQYEITAVEKLAQQLQATNILVLVFPTWWFGFPAILKGWFDRVWAPGIAFDHAKDFAPIKPLLINLKHVLVVTSLGSPWWVDWLIMRRPVKRIVKNGLVGACAPNAKVDFLSIYGAEKLSLKQIAGFERRIEKTIANWK